MYIYPYMNVRVYMNIQISQSTLLSSCPRVFIANQLHTQRFSLSALVSENKSQFSPLQHGVHEKKISCDARGALQKMKVKQI